MGEKVVVKPEPTKVPDRKVFAGGLAGLLSWGVIVALNAYGYPMPVYLQALLPTVVGSLIAYLTPPALRDIVNRLNDDIVAVAQNDPKIPVTPPSKT